MDWKLLLIGVVMLVPGAMITWRFRNAGKSHDIGPGCAITFGLVLAITGVCALVVGFLAHG